MTLRSFALPLLSALSVLAFAGCAADTEPTTDDAADESSEALSANAWRHQPGFDLSCTSGVKNVVSPTSRRHYYSFAGDVSKTTSFDLRGTWPNAWGATMIVTDLSGKVLGSATNWKDNSVGVTVSFESDAKHFVYVSPAVYWKVGHKYGYTLSASCEANGSCNDAGDCKTGQACAMPVCIKAPCNVLGTCVDAAYCAEYTTKDGRFYAKNFTSYDAAKFWTQQDPELDTSDVRKGHCDEQLACAEIYAPVCGTPVSTNEPTNFGNACEFQNAIRSAAGTTGESKGKWTAGACPDVDFCAVVTFTSSGYDYVYAQNANSEADAQKWIDDFAQPGKTGTVLAGPCDQPTACPALYKPVCGIVKNGGKHTYSNACAFAAAVKADAGGEAPDYSKGYASAGKCTCDYNDPARSYIVKSAEQCKAVKFACAVGKSPFFDECGCGCE